MAKIHLLEIATVFRRQGLLDQFREQEPLLVWNEIAGENMAKLAAPLRVREGIFYIQVKNPVVAQQLEMLKDRYLKKLNEALIDTKITDLRFRVGKIHVQSEPEEPIMEPEQFDDSLVSKVLNEIEEGPLRDSLESMMRYHLTLDARRKQEGFKECTQCGSFHEETGSICYHCKAESGVR